MNNEIVRKIYIEGPGDVPAEYGNIVMGFSEEEIKEIVRRSGAEFAYQHPELVDADKPLSNRRDKLVELVKSTKAGMQILSSREYNFKTEYWKSILPKVVEIIGW